MKPLMMSRLAALTVILALVMPSPAQAQTIAYGDTDQSAAAGGDADEPSEDGAEDGAMADGIGGLSRRTGKLRVTPYIEVQQVISAQLSPTHETLTYSTLAAGIDANLTGRNAQAGIAARYERRFGWGNSQLSDSDVISGIGRASVGIIPRTLFLEGGVLAARLSVENNGAGTPGLEFGNNSSQVYGAYIGPSLKTQLGVVDVEGHYQFGYSRVSSPRILPVAAGQSPIDLYDEGTQHNAQIHAGTRAGTFLPIGIGLGAGWIHEDTSNLDQRVDDKHVRGDVTLPVSGDLALVAGVGYEKVQVSQRNAVFDTLTGLPVRSRNGHYVTDQTQPRQLAYDVEGLIWDAGVLWRPSKRTALEAHLGRRYGSATYFGSFAYAPNARMILNVSVYDGISGFGGRLNRALAALPTQFEGQRNPLTGGVGTCVTSVPGSASNGGSGGTCLNGALGSLRSATFRGRGVTASLGITGTNLQYGIGAGYDRHTFFAAPGTVLAQANGVIDETVWTAAYVNGRIDRNSSFGTNVWANWYQSGDAFSGNSRSIGATAAYYRTLADNLTGTAAVGISGVDRQSLQDIWTASALIGLRYSF